MTQAGLFNFPRPTRSTRDVYNVGNSPTVANETQLRREMGRMRRRQSRSGLFTGQILVTEGFTLRAPLVNDISGLGIIGIGLPLIKVEFFTNHDYVLRMTQRFQSLDGLLFYGDEQAIIAGEQVNPTSFLELGAASYAYVNRVWTALGTTYSILSTERAGRVWIQDCQLEKDMSLNLQRGWVKFNSTGNITLQAEASQVSLVGNNMGNGDDSASLGGNSATANTGAGSFAAWTGPGSTATGNV